MKTLPIILVISLALVIAAGADDKKKHQPAPVSRGAGQRSAPMQQRSSYGAQSGHPGRSAYSGQSTYPGRSTSSGRSTAHGRSTYPGRSTSSGSSSTGRSTASSRSSYPGRSTHPGRSVQGSTTSHHASTHGQSAAKSSTSGHSAKSAASHSSSVSSPSQQGKKRSAAKSSPAVSRPATGRVLSKNGKTAAIHTVSATAKARGDSHYHHAIGSFHRSIHTASYYHSHYARVVVVNGGGGYYFNEGYWFPAYGYAPDFTFAFDGPIACYDELPPDQVVVNVQTELQGRGYYTAEPGGELDEDTRSSIASFQEDAGLEVTYTVDEPTLTALGLI